MSELKPRAVALGIVLHDGAILMEKLYGEHEHGTGTFYRPPGGGIEYMEHSRDAVVREMREELDAEVEVLEYLGCVENVLGTKEDGLHELLQLYRVRFLDGSLYARDDLRILDNGITDNPAVWVPMADFPQLAQQLYPLGIAELLTAWQERRTV